jgi:diguanylate cyclase (GGDEF)-like protein/PAS domain S-box-containing protein
MQSHKLSSLGGEFVRPATEEAFQAERFPETLRHAKLLFIASAILNTLFFLSDWRFYGEPHFLVAAPARASVVMISLVCLALISRATSFARAERVMVLWQGVCGAGVGVLVSSHSEIALFVVIMLPSIFYLVVPTSFRWTMISGIGCSLMLLVGFLSPQPQSPTVTGIVLAMLVLNVALILVVSHSNRLRRLEWAATQAERRVAEELAESRRMFENMFMSVPVPLLVTSQANGRVLKFNDAAEAFFGTPENNLEYVSDLYVDAEARTRFINALAERGRVSGFETVIRVADGTTRDVLLAATAVKYEGEAAIMASAVDISSRKTLERRLEHLATTDSLTGLLNRGHFIHTAEVEMERSRRYGRAVSLLMVDIDHFKKINDTYGHMTGDWVLTAFAKLCGDCLRQQDCIARFGGEEFAILLPETDELAAVAVAERFREAVSKLKIEGAGDTLLSVSIGISGIDVSEDTLTAALDRADIALYAAKRRGRNRVVFYTDNLREAGAA